MKDTIKALEVKDLLTLLAFATALAAYLANVAREIVKAIKASSADQQLPGNKDWETHKRNIYWMGIAEACLVLFGLLTATRLLSYVFVLQSLHKLKQAVGLFSSDAFLLTFLSLILMSLGIRHLVVWLEEKPWEF